MSVLSVCTLIILLFLSFFAARIAAKQTERVRILLLAVTGWVLLLLEIYKQVFFFFVVNDRVYDFWIFPFQLCSVPMYLCPLLPVLQERARKTVLTFLWDYTFFGALLALIYPEGLIRPYLSMTVHGFLWHALLLFISFTVLLSGMADFSFRSFRNATLLFFVCCGIATLINVLAEGKGLATSYPDMFYLTPYRVSTQPVAHSVDVALGIPAGRALYILVLVLFGLCDHLLYRFFTRLCRA